MKCLMAGIYIAASHHDLGATALNKVLELKEAQDTAAAAAVQRKTNEQRQLELEVENISVGTANHNQQNKARYYTSCGMDMSAQIQ